MSLDDRILDSLRVFGPSMASEIAARVGALLAVVDRHLGMMCGSRVACTRGVWRLLDSSAASSLSHVALGMRALYAGRHGVVVG
jgi:hypothetical protein